MKPLNSQPDRSGPIGHGQPSLKQLALAAVLAGACLSAQADLARVGPANVPSPPGNGFPLWYQDLNGMVLDLCLPNATDPGASQQAACLLTGPGLPNPPYVFPTNFPDEMFYLRAVSPAIDMTAGKRAVIVLAVEAAFGSGAPQAGQQMVFTRIRVTAGVPEPGTYTVTHPYGVETFTVDTVGVGNRDIAFTEDVGLAPGNFTDALHSRVGPFLQRTDPTTGAPLGPMTINGAQFLSDGVALETVTGSPFNTNYVMICGVTNDVVPAPISLGSFTLPDGTVTNCAGDSTFTLTGRLHDLVASPIGSPLTITRANYGRDPIVGTHVDVNANVVKALATQPNPLLTAASANQLPVLMSGPTPLGDWYAQGITDPSGALPNAVTVINSADNPPSAVTRNVVDVVSVSSATFAPDPLAPNTGAGTLTVVATSSDKGFAGSLPPIPSLQGFPGAVPVASGGTADPAQYTFTIPVTTPPPSVAVLSSAGGVGRADVTGAQGPAFNAGVVFAQDDVASATAGGAFVDIPVIANDRFNPAAPPDAAQPIIPLLPTLAATDGTVTIGTGIAGSIKNPSPIIPLGSIRFEPSTAVGTFTFRYAVKNAVGASNPATVTLDVAPGAGGPVPIATADGPFNVNPGATLNIPIATLLANDSGNGGTLDPATFQIVTGSVTGGTASINGTNVVYAANNTPGTNFGFDYTVANTNGNPSTAAHVTVVIQAEQIVVTTNRCTRSGTTGQWNVRGTDSIFPGTVITLFNTATAPANPTAAQTIGSATVDGLGAWTFRVNVANRPCVSPISLRSSVGTAVNNIGIQIR